MASQVSNALPVGLRYGCTLNPIQHADFEEVAAAVRLDPVVSPGCGFARKMHASGQSWPQKDSARSWVGRMHHPFLFPKKLRVLTLPGLKWPWERHLINIRGTEGLETEIHALENEPSIFKASLKYIPGDSVSLPPVAIKPEAALTPGKWKLEGSRDADDLTIVQESTGAPIAIISETLGYAAADVANGEFIVRACNSHYQILAALKAMSAIVKAVIKDRDEGGAYHSLPGFGGKTITENLHESLAVIAKAEAVQA